MKGRRQAEEGRLRLKQPKGANLRARRGVWEASEVEKGRERLLLPLAAARRELRRGSRGCKGKFGKLLRGRKV